MDLDTQIYYIVKEARYRRRRKKKEERPTMSIPSNIQARMLMEMSQPGSPFSGALGVAAQGKKMAKELSDLYGYLTGTMYHKVSR